jgi:hypothetical protein
MKQRRRRLRARAPRSPRPAVQDGDNSALHGLDRLAQISVDVEVSEERLELPTHIH